MNTIEVATTAVLFGFIAGITPGPLMALIMSETLRHGKGVGIKIALAPLITDLPIMLVSVFILSKLSHLNIVLGTVALIGSLYLGYLAYESIKIKKVHLDLSHTAKKSVMKGVVANFLNPNPYIFFFSVGGPIIVRAMKQNLINGPLFVFIFLAVLVGVNIFFAGIVHKSRKFIQSNAYVYTIRTLGVVLFLFAMIFFKQSIELFLSAFPL